MDLVLQCAGSAGTGRRRVRWRLVQKSGMRRRVMRGSATALVVVVGIGAGVAVGVGEGVRE